MTHDEMQLAIAHLLGWVQLTERPAEEFPRVLAGLLDVDPANYWQDPADPESGFHADPFPDWPNDIAVCFRDLVPVARERGWGYFINGPVPGTKDTVVQAGFFQGIEGSTIHAGYDDHPARALCEAWLAGPGKEVAS